MALSLLIQIQVLVGKIFFSYILIIEFFIGGCGIEDEDAGYYVDATESKWSENYQMFSYVNDEFYELIIQNFNVDINRIGIFG
jgi:S-formylglutathione hydrolase FrmB